MLLMVFKKLKSFVKLSKRRKILFFKVVMLSLFKPILKLLHSPQAFTENLIPPASAVSADLLANVQLEKVRDIAAAIELGRKYIPWKNQCRHQAWQAAVLLRRSGIPYSYHVGIKKRENNAVEGHAWVLVGERFVSGRCKLSEYREIKF